MQQHSERLIAFLATTLNPNPEIASQGIAELMARTSELFEDGRPNLRLVRGVQTVRGMARSDRALVAKCLYALLRNFCNSLNVVRNMTQDQMIEAATILIDESADLTLDDYIIMFSLAKRGKLVKIYDRMDLPTIIAMLDSYYSIRSLKMAELDQQIDLEQRKARMEKLLDDEQKGKVKDFLPQLKEIIEDLCGKSKTDDEPNEDVKSQMKAAKIEIMQKRLLEGGKNDSIRNKPPEIGQIIID